MPASLGEFFTFIGSAAAIGFVLSFVAENWPFFQTRSSQGKMIILVVIALAMGLGSYGLVRYVPAGVIEAAQPIYQVIVSTITILLASQIWHKVTDKSPAPNVESNVKFEATTKSAEPLMELRKTLPENEWSKHG